ncbi:MAG: TetR/AcrR family transcriptional regulator [Variovorax sp.]
MPLGQALAAQPAGLGKRERTRRQLLLAAVQVFSARGVSGSTIQEIAHAAGMTTGTVYNHFDTKEAIVVAVAVWLAETLCNRINDSQRGIERGAQRMAIGQRRYCWLASESPTWTLMLLDIAASVPSLTSHIARYAFEDLRLGIAQEDFRVPSEAAAMNLIMGMGFPAMRDIAMGLVPPDHDIAVATTVLRGLGVPFAKAAEIAQRALPDFGPPAEPVAPAATRAARKTRPKARS